jgi:hypothetical protein
MPIFLTSTQTTPIIAAGRRGDVQALEKDVAALAETFGVVRGEILLSAKDEHGNTVLHASSELGLTGMRPNSRRNNPSPSNK